MTDFALPARLPPPRASSRRSSLAPGSQTASFGDLVHAHWQWKHEHADDDAHREHYEAKRTLFEAEHGKIVDDYWSTREPAAVAVCCLRTRRGHEQWALHRSTARLAADHPEYATPAARHRAPVRARRQRPVRHDPADRDVAICSR